MKNLYFLVLVLLLSACSTNELEKTTTVSGVITNQNSPKLTISKGDFKQEFTLDDEGKFSGTITNISAGNYTMNDGSESASLYIIPGQDFSLKMDASKFDETLVYEGPGAPANNYLVQKVLEEEKNNINYKEFFSLPEADYLKQLGEMEAEGTAFLDNFKGLPATYIAEEKKAIYFERLGFISNYKSAHEFYTNSEITLSPDFLKPLAAVKMDNEADFKNIRAYKELVLNHYSNMETEATIAALPSIKSAVIKKGVLRNLEYAMSPGSEELEIVYNGLMANLDDEEYKKGLTEKFEKYKTLAKGNPSPRFNYQDKNGNMVALEDLKGKNVYIDVWATWCGPCKAEIPSLKALESEYHDKNIEFVSLSIDKMKDKEKWLKMIEEKELKGVQVMADNDWNSEFVKDYGIRGIPRFILLDDKGNIVTPDAPRPSSDSKIKGMINELKI